MSDRFIIDLNESIKQEDDEDYYIINVSMKLIYPILNLIS